MYICFKTHSFVILHWHFNVQVNILKSIICWLHNIYMLFLLKNKGIVQKTVSLTKSRLVYSIVDGLYMALKMVCICYCRWFLNAHLC